MESSSTNYNILLKRLKDRDELAFELLYQDTRATLYVIAFEILEDEDAALDLVQDFYIDFWQQKIYDHVESSLKGYLLRAIRNRAYKLIRKRQTKEKLVRLSPFFPTTALPERKTEQEELGESINRAMKKVPKASAKAFSLHYIEELSHAKIANLLEISPHTVRNQIAKALRILREELKKND